MPRVVRQAERGFTLVEVMIVVVIVGIMATLATYGIARYIRHSKTTEAIQVIGSIKAQQESYRGDMLEYLDVAGSNTITTTSYYPVNTPPKNKAVAWGDVTTPLGQRFRQLGVVVDTPVRFVYATTAGPGSVAPAGDQLPNTVVANWPTTATGQPWYVVSARADLNGVGVLSAYSSASFTGLIFRENEDE